LGSPQKLIYQSQGCVKFPQTIASAALLNGMAAKIFPSFPKPLIDGEYITG
jgi:hypothetical protein